MAFLRSDITRHKRLGSHRNKLQKWRRPRGRHNKIRRKRTGYPLRVEIGYRTPVEGRNTSAGKKILIVHNAQELAQATTKQSIVFARTLGAKKRIELLRQATERNLTIQSRKGTA